MMWPPESFSIPTFTYSKITGLVMILCGIGSFSYIARIFRVFRGALMRRNPDLDELRRALAEAKTEISRQDVALADSGKEVKEGRQKMELQEKSLQEALDENRVLNARLEERERELQGRGDELQEKARQHAEILEVLETRAQERQRREEERLKLESEHTLALELLESRTQELHTAEAAFLLKADASSPADVLSLMNTLNFEISQTAASVAAAFEFRTNGTRLEERNAEVEGLAEVYASVTDTVGPKMVEMLESPTRLRGPLLVQIAFQAAMTAYSNWIVKSWNLEEPEADIGFNKVYKGIRDTEEQAMAGRWRALTRKHLPRPEEHELSYLFVDAIINILLVANAVLSHDQLLHAVEKQFAERITTIVRSAQRLRKAIGEDITLCDLEVIFFNHDTPFSPTQMDDTFAEVSAEQNAVAGDPVMCTTELGLVRFERRAGKDAIWDETILLKPKIALRSGIDAAISSMANEMRP
ncbi:hypothetical protein H0H93_007613 [Arthromyces matolae]|nr:hypothetical protein H0H93_007613 [Arthromyces matolae]